MRSLVQSAKIILVECWIPKLATDANGAVAITTARYKPDPPRAKNSRP